MKKCDPFKYFNSSEEIIRLAVMLYVRFPLSLRNAEDLLHERRIDISHETVRFRRHRNACLDIRHPTATVSTLPSSNATATVAPGKP
jgi:hypothetical protein